jgi:hypothetical protein
MELALSITLFVAMFASWCVLPNGSSAATRTATPPHGAPQQA